MIGGQHLWRKGTVLVAFTFCWMAVVQPVTAQGTPCTGDCNGNGVVTIDELVMMVHMVLKRTAVTGCEAGDANQNGKMEVADIVAAVSALLHGCSITPAPSPFATATATPPPCGDGLIQPPEECDCGHPCAGCDPHCQVEPMFRCEGQPSVCFIVGPCGGAQRTCPTGLPTPTETPTPP